jgi:hypothetical protein
MKIKIILLILLFITPFILKCCEKKACSKTRNTYFARASNKPLTADASLFFKFKFYSTQTRLSAFWKLSIIPMGHITISPVFNKILAYHIELAQIALSQLGRDAYYSMPKNQFD